MVYEFYMEQSSIDLVTSPFLIPNIPLRLRPQSLFMLQQTQLHPASGDPPSSQVISGVGGDIENREDTSYRSYRKQPLLL